MDRKIPTGAWIVVADGAKARFLSNVGTAAKVSLKQDRLVEPQNLDDDGPSGSMPADASGFDHDEATFAKQLAHRINAAALKQEFAHLVLVADPQTLGQMRPLLHLETSNRLLGELAKTLTNSPLADIERALSRDD
jgi:protein required for attachment to host cells